VDTAEKEIAMWFDEEKIFPWQRINEDWISGLN
jgi:hypothetical protein